VRHFFATLVLVSIVALSGCAVTEGMTAEEKTMFRDAAVAEAEYRIEQLQELDLLKFKVGVEVLIAADAACSFISIASPYLVIVLNRKTAEANLSRAADDQKELITVEQFQANLHAICTIARKLLKAKTPDVPEPEPIAT